MVTFRIINTVPYPEELTAVYPEQPNALPYPEQSNTE
jgi:hypothetical protein